MSTTAEIHVPNATTQPQKYKERLLELAAEVDDPLAAMAETPSTVREIVAAVDDALLIQQPADGEWSVAQTVGHLFDVDIVYGFRWRLVATEDNPSYPGYDEKKFTLLPRQDFHDSLEAWCGLRDANVILARELHPEGWQRRGRHGEQGGETYEEMVLKVVGHDIAHLNQIRRTIEAVGD